MSARGPVLMRGALTTPALSVFLIVVIAALSFLGVAAPAMLADGRSATVQRAVASLPQLSRWPSATTPGLPGLDAPNDPDTGIWRSALSALQQKRQEQPEPLRSLLGTPRITVMIDPEPTTGSSDGASVPLNKVGLVSDPGLQERADLVEGRLPDVTAPSDAVEIALTETVADALEWPVGVTRQWDDLSLVLTGVVAPSGRDDADWAFIGGSAEPLVEIGQNGDRTLIGAAFTHRDEAAELADRVSDYKITSWIPFDSSDLDAETAGATAAQLRLLSADPLELRMHDDTFFNRGLAFGSSIPRAVDSGVVRGGAMTAVVTVAAVGPVAVALVVLALVSRLIAVRRIETVRVLRARGASLGRLVALLGGEGIALGVLGAAVGAAAAAAVSGWTGAAALLAPVALAAVPAVVLPWGALTDAERRGRSDLGDARGGGAGRFALQVLVIALTVVLAALIVTRGSAGGVDPLLLALPVLLGGSGSVLALRLLPLALEVAERRGRAGRSLAALLGPARARRDPVVRAAPVLASVIGLGVAVFSVAFATTVSEGIVRSASITVGADVRVDAPYVSAAGAERVADLDGVACTAGLHGDSVVEAAVGPRSERATLYTIDRDRMVAVQQDASGALALPAALGDPADDAVPVVISETLLHRLGDDPADLDLEVGGTPLRVVGVAPSQVPFGTAEQWIIVDTGNAAELGERSTGLSQIYLSLAPGADPDAVGTAAVDALGAGASYETPARAAAEYEQDPAYDLVRGALLAASAIVALLLAVAIVATLVLGAASRARMLAILRTLGHPQRAAGRLVAWEVAPALLLALPFGVGAGIGMALLVIPQLDLRGFVGGTAQPAVVVGSEWSVLVVAGFALVVASAVLVATAFASRLGAASAIRADDDVRGQ